MTVEARIVAQANADAAAQLAALLAAGANALADGRHQLNDFTWRDGALKVRSEADWF